MDDIVKGFRVEVNIQSFNPVGDFGPFDAYQSHEDVYTSDRSFETKNEAIDAAILLLQSKKDKV